MSPLSILFSPVEQLSRLNQKRNMYFVCKTETVKKICRWIMMCVMTTGMAFFTGGRVMNYYGLIFWPEAML